MKSPMKSTNHAVFDGIFVSYGMGCLCFFSWLGSNPYAQLGNCLVESDLLKVFTLCRHFFPNPSIQEIWLPTGHQLKHIYLSPNEAPPNSSDFLSKLASFPTEWCDRNFESHVIVFNFDWHQHLPISFPTLPACDFAGCPAGRSCWRCAALASGSASGHQFREGTFFFFRCLDKWGWWISTCSYIVPISICIEYTWIYP